MTDNLLVRAVRDPAGLTPAERDDALGLALKRIAALESELSLILETQRDMKPVNPDDDPYTLAWKSAWGMVASIARRALESDV